MKSHLSGMFTTVLVISIVGCGSSNDSTNDLMRDAIPSSLLRLKEVTITRVGIPDMIMSIDYTETGNLLRQTFRRNDEIVRVRTFETTTDGRLIRHGDDIDQDGIEDLVIQYVYNSSANLSRVEELGSNGLIDYVKIYAFQNGLVISRENRDIEDVATSEMVDIASGTLASSRNFEYEQGRLSAINIDTVGNSVFDQRDDFSYNANGTLAITSLSSIIDGVIGTNSFVYEQAACTLWGDTTAAYYCVNPI